MNNDYLDEDEEQELWFPSEDSEDEDSDDGESGDNLEDEEDLDSSIYKDRMSSNEVRLLEAYDDIVKSKDDIKEATFVVVMANPQHTSSNTVSQIIKDIFHQQGHSRMQNLQFTPTSMLKGEDVDSEVDEDDDNSFNSTYANEARKQITRFIGYLASRDLSKDSVVSRRRKQRQIPAFIIFLFSSGMFDLILNCPTMPKEYDDQIQNALKKINKAKFDIVEELANRYDAMGRPKVAKKVRDLGLGWFSKEPAEIKYAAEYRDLGLTSDDVSIYREYRGRFTNTSSAITQDVISDLIEVAVDPEKQIYEKLKDKTRKKFFRAS